MDRGVLITLEGIDGAGKSTQADALATCLGEHGFAVVTTFEPGATPLGAHLRRILLEGDVQLSPDAELLLFCADRADHVHHVIEPALAAGKVVICDRFVDSTIAYQGYGRQGDLAHVARWNTESSGGLRPDLTLLLDCPIDEGARRRRRATDRYQRQDVEYHQRVRQGFLALADAEPERFTIIDSAVALPDLTLEVTSTVLAWLAADGRAVGG